MINLSYIAFVWKILDEKLSTMIFKSTATSNSIQCINGSKITQSFEEAFNPVQLQKFLKQF